jgi:hypothetical protein
MGIPAMIEELDYPYGKLRSIRPLSPEIASRLPEDFMIDFTYNSNAIEGSTLTLEETWFVLKEALRPAENRLNTIWKQSATGTLITSSCPHRAKSLSIQASELSYFIPKMSSIFS